MKVYKEIEFYTDGGRNTVEVAFHVDAKYLNMLVKTFGLEG